MGKVKRLLSFLTATFVAASFVLSGSIVGALSADKIKAEIDKIIVEDSNGNRKPLKDFDGWSKLFSELLEYAEVTEADIKMDDPPDQNDNWANWFVRPDGFKADPNDEAGNIMKALENFGHNNGYWHGNYRVKSDYTLLPDWGALHYTVENKNGEAKGYPAFIYSNSKFANKIREIYNLDPATNKNKRDVLCLRAIFRAMFEYDKYLGLNPQDSLDAFAERLIATAGTASNVIYFIANDRDTNQGLGIKEDFSLQDRAPRKNAVDDYKKIARMLIVYYYLAKGKTENVDYRIIYDENGYVLRIEPIVAGKAASKPSGGSVIKRTGSEVDHLIPEAFALAACLSGIAGLGYVVSRKRKKNSR